MVLRESSVHVWVDVGCMFVCVYTKVTFSSPNYKFTFDSSQLFIECLHSFHQVLETSDLRLEYDGRRAVSIRYMGPGKGNLRGLCGSNDDNPDNDFMSKDLQVRLIDIEMSYV